MAEYGLQRPFFIDNGELDDLRPNEIFVLGYELCMIDELLNHPDSISRMVHSENVERIKWNIEQTGRDHKFTWPHNDSSESWVQLDVAPVDGPLNPKREEPTDA
jgi:hypothetical protein